MNLRPNNRILLVDDNPAIHDDFQKVLRRAPQAGAELTAVESALFDKPTSPVVSTTFELSSAYQGQEALEKVRQSVAAGRPYALAFVDVRMPPGWDGIETIGHLWEVDPALQIVVCTAYSDYSWETMTAHLGINDNLVILKKPFDNIEVLQLAHALTKKWQVTQQAVQRMETLDQMVAERTRALEQSNAELRRSEERFAKAFQANPIPSAIQTLHENRFVDVNEAFVEMTGYARAELVGRTPLDLRLCLDYGPVTLEQFLDEKPGRHIAAQISTKGGELRNALVSVEKIDVSGEPHLLLMAVDISQQQSLQPELRQAQKLEAIGQFAAGVAHDFNNLLTIIQGHSSLQLSIPGHSEDALESLRQITLASERAADLTRQLLAFSRRQVMFPNVIHVNAFILDLVPMLGRLVGDRIELVNELAEGVPPIWADQTSLEQIITNMALNARDAMPTGGRLTIATSARTITPAERDAHPEATPGEYVVLSISDTGSGMDAATRSRIFEPFFTTKKTKKGIGLGLSTAYGITKQHGGWIEVASAPGQGSQFRVFLPATDRTADAPPPSEGQPAPSAHKPLILVVEDDEAVRSLVCEVLDQSGYRLLEAEHADAALEIWRERASEIDLLLTDLVMPGSLNGLELAKRLLAERPDLKVIYTSGYSTELFAGDVQFQEGRNYLPKPYLSDNLKTIVRRAVYPENQPAG